jgi:hypothetical protein
MGAERWEAHRYGGPERRQPPFEFFIAAVGVLVIACVYAGFARRGPPAPGSLAGFLLGVAGFLLMIGAQTLYSLRKKLPWLHWGATRRWLQVHIILGLIGPFLIVLHSAGKFNGLAGLLLGLTLLMVASGFVGNYIYTAVPRDLGGAAVAREKLVRRREALEAELAMMGVEPAWLARVMFEARLDWPWWLALWARPLALSVGRRRVRRAAAALPALAARQDLERLLIEDLRLRFRLQTWAAARRTLARWHLFHVPLSVIVMTLALVHVAGALYYTTIVR